MSISLTRILQQITGLNTFFQGPNAGRSNGVVLEDSATVTWTTDGQGNIQATAAGGATFPTATAAGQLLTATGPGTTYTAQAPAVTGLTLIQAITASGSQASITFSAIPQTYSSLLLIDNAEVAGTAETYEINFNGDAGANYSYGFVINNTGSVTGNTTTPSTFGNIGAVGAQGGHKVTIPGYASAAIKSYLAESLAFDGASSFIQQSAAGVWNNAAAITSITISNTSNFTANSKFSLYGIE